MQSLLPVRFGRGMLAAGVVLAHVLLAYLFIQSRVPAPDMGDPEPVMASLLDDPRDARAGLQPVEIEAQLVIPKRGPDLKMPEVPADDAEVPPPQAPASLQSIPAPAATPPAMSGAAVGSSGGQSRDGVGLAIVQRTLPKYPLTSVRLGEEGSSIVQIHVDERGRVSEVKLARSSGFSRLDDAAVQAVRKWKFAPAMKNGKATSSWGEMELRFNLYRFTYSRLGERPADRIAAEQTRQGASEVATPGGEAALRRFIDDLSVGNVPGAQSTAGGKEIAKIRTALGEWGAVRSVQFTGGVGAHDWSTYDIKPEYRGDEGRSTTEVRWDMYEVRHEHGISEWRVAIGRDGTVWAAQAGAAPANR